MLRAKAYAKINLYLKVLGRRPDGFHEMETVMQKLGMCDILTLEVQDGEGIDLVISGDTELSVQGNLVTRACQLYLKNAGMKKRVAATLEKNIFIAAGLGGGSSNAACAMTLMNQALDCFSFEELLKMAEELGSDVPFFLYDTSMAFAYGRGEKIQPMNTLPPKPFVLVNPGFGISTPEIYRALGRPEIEKTQSKPMDKNDFPSTWEDFLAKFPLQNDLQSVAEQRFPQLVMLRDKLISLGAKSAMMTGSGSTVFGIFDQDTVAITAEAELKKNGFRAVFVSSL